MTMKTLTAVFLLSLAVKDCSAASLDPGTCVAKPDVIITNPCRIVKDNCTKPFTAITTVGTCTCECDLILNEKPEEICCDTKKVGEYSYTKVSVGEVLPSCINNCIYTRDDEPGSKYCFARGEQEVHCLDYTGAANGTAIILATDTEMPQEANTEGESCRIVASGPFGVHASNEVPFNDRIVSSNGNITQIDFRTGWWMDQIQASYGNIQSTPHGGAGGDPTGPYLLQGSNIVAVEGIIHYQRRGAQPYIQSVTFTDQSGNTHGPFGPTDNAKHTFRSAPNNCFLRYLSGSTTGSNPQAPSGNYVNQLTFNWCCPA